MPSGDFTDLATRACYFAQFDPTDTSGDLARAKEEINAAYLSVCAMGPRFDFLEQEGQWTTTAGSDVYTYASIAAAMSISGATIEEILYLTNDSDGHVLESMSWSALEKGSWATQDDEGRGVPTSWAKWNTRVRLYPTPDAVYTIGAFVRLAPNEMSANGDTPLIPLSFRHRLLVPLAAANLLRQEGGQDAHMDATRLQAQADEAYLAMRTAHASARHPTFILREPSWIDDQEPEPYWWTR